MINYCHLSYEERKNIEDGLNSRKSINKIAKETFGVVGFIKMF